MRLVSRGWIHRGPEVCWATCLVAIVLLLWNRDQHHDVVWQLWIGRQLLHGAELYGDIIELNPPLWFWIAIPLNWAAERTGVAAGNVMILFIASTITLCLLLVSRLLRTEAPLYRLTIYMCVLAVTTLMLLYDFGQREHFALIATIPYVVLVARRSTEQLVPWPEAVTIGALAALGFALKHYFALVPLSLEAWLWLTGVRRPVRFETMTVGLLALAYGIAVWLFAPKFVTEIVPMIGLAYEGYERPLLEQFSQPVIPVYIVAGLAFALYGRPNSRIAQAAIVASLAFMAAYFMQQKGWRYHSLPAAGLMILAIAAELLERRFDSFRKRATIPLFGFALAVPFVMSVAETSYINTSRKEVEFLLQGTRRGESVMMLSANASRMWPMVEERGLLWPSRHFTFWMLPSVATHPTRERFALAYRIRRETAHDLACNPPTLILVDDTSGRSWQDARGFDILEFFAADREIADLLRDYKPRAKQTHFIALDRVSNFASRRPPNCRRIW